MALGACTDMSAVTGGYCLDQNSGSLVSCSAASCSQPTLPSAENPAPYGTPVPVVTNPTTITTTNAGGFDFNTPFTVDSLATKLQTIVNEKASPFTMNAIANGADTVANQTNNIATQAANYCALYPDACKGVNVSQLVAQAQQSYVNYVTQQPQAEYVQGGSTTKNLLNTVVPQAQTLSQAPTTNVLNPPTGGTSVTPSSIANTANQGLNTTNSTSVGSGVPASGVAIPSDITTWIQNNWIAVAAVMAMVILARNK